MKIAKIKTQYAELASPEFETEEEVINWITPLIEINNFGKPAYTEKFLVGDPKFDEDGNDISEYQIIEHEAEFTYSIEDADLTPSQDEINFEAKKFLAECDWKRNRHLSQKAIGIETSLSDEEYFHMEIACQEARSRIV